ncbi:hypothetical protein [Marmoricola sp. URHB0036]|uniref:Acg family FMN-binding oxidoreductase n=1 Tax=Marmoricola sp. URHB0036 TaxID=1298863 RepID=UPI0012DC61EB|nr:hypothetical protein [Marmoricola sp. URHB0036]
MTAPTMKVTRELVRMACRAPSIHNTQPWAWRLTAADTVELYADRGRQLDQIDPEGRALTISCGAALHHLVVAAEGFGLVAGTHLRPDPDNADFLARIHLEPGETTDASVQTMAALENRMTDRRGFTDWEVPGTRLHHLADAATGWGAHALPVTDPGLAVRVGTLVEEAGREERENTDIATEQEDWIAHSPVDGVPVSNASPRPSGGVERSPDRFNPGASSARTGSSDALLLLFTSADDQSAWLATGQALSAIWILAAQGGLSLTPETQVIEVARTRQQLRHSLLDDLGHPQVLVHVGWQESSRPPQVPTPRRDLEDVLLP